MGYSAKLDSASKHAREKIGSKSKNANLRSVWRSVLLDERREIAHSAQLFRAARSVANFETVRSLTCERKSFLGIKSQQIKSIISETADSLSRNTG